MMQAAVDAAIDAHYLAGSAAAVRYVQALAAEVLRELGLWRLEPEPRSLDEVAAALGVVPEVRFALAWLLEDAADAGATSDVERRGRELAAAAPASGASRELLDYAASRYPDYLRGARSGAAILLKPPAVKLWEAYFSAANPFYDVHNRLGWTGLREALARLGRPARAVELGAGTGGGTGAVLAGLAEDDEAAGRIASLTITDVSPSFLVGTLERLRAASPPVPLERRKLDFGRPLADQGFPPGSIDVFFGVNALHNGADLGATLAALAQTLAPDGFLVVSESICGAGEHVHQEFIFNLLPLPRPPRQDAVGTPGSRFFTAAAWRQALAASPFRAEVHANTQGPELALLALARPA